MSKSFTVYLAQRHEYIYNVEWLDDENYKEIVTYTGKKTLLLSKDREHVLYKGVPHWKAEIIGEFTAVLGHVSGGSHKYMIDRTPITIIN